MLKSDVKQRFTTTTTTSNLKQLRRPEYARLVESPPVLIYIHVGGRSAEGLI